MPSFERMSSTYDEYKVATRTFVKWILEASNTISKISKRIRSDTYTLGGLLERTTILTKNPHYATTLKKSYLTQFSTIMNAGYHAIKLRTNFYAIYSANLSNDEEQQKSSERHKYCIDVLKRCYKMLYSWMDEAKLLQNEPRHNEEQSSEDGKTAAKGSSFNAFSCLEELEKPDDTEVNLETNSVLKGCTIEEIDARVSDIRVSALCLFHDLKLLSKKVEEIWTDIAQLEKSVFTAVGTCIFACNHIKEQMTLFQKKFPHISTFHEFARCCVENQLPTEESVPLTDIPFFSQQCEIADGLLSIAGKFQEHPQYVRIDRDANLFDELSKKHFEISDLMIQICCLHSYFGCFDTASGNGLICSFLERFQRFFIDGIVTVPLVFIAHCWFQSTSIVMNTNEKRIGRILHYLQCIQETNMGFVKDLVEKQQSTPSTEGINRLLYGVTTDSLWPNCFWQSFVQFQKIFASISSGFGFHLAKHANLMLVGCCVMEELIICNEISLCLKWKSAHLIHNMLHAYHALQTEGFLNREEVPILNSFLHHLQPLYFADSKLPTRGNYALNMIRAHRTYNGDNVDIKYVLQQLLTYQETASINKIAKQLSSTNERTIHGHFRTSSDISNILQSQDLSSCSQYKYLDKKINHIIFQLETMFHAADSPWACYYSLNILQCVLSFHEVVDKLMPVFRRVAFELQRSHDVHYAILKRDYPFLAEECLDKYCRYSDISFALDREIADLLNKLDNPTQDPVDILFFVVFADAFREVFGLQSSTAENMFSHKNKVYLFIPHQSMKAWLLDEFGSVKYDEKHQCDRDILNERCSELHNDISTLLNNEQQQPDALLKYTLKLKIKQYCREYPLLVTMYHGNPTTDSNNQRSLFEEVVFGLWTGDIEFADWLLNMWAFSFAPAAEQSINYYIRAFHRAIQLNMLWLVEKMLVASNKASFLLDSIDETTGNSVLHQAKGMFMVSLLEMFCAPTSIINNAGEHCFHIFRDEATLVSYRADYHNARLDRIAIAKQRLGMCLPTVVPVESNKQSLQQKERKNVGDNVVKCTTYSAEDVRKAKELERELLKQLEEEEIQQYKMKCLNTNPTKLKTKKKKKK